MTPEPSHMANFITIDGIEGAGKSTQAARLADALRRDGHEVVLTREPGGTELGRALRRMLLEDDSPGPTAETELLLYLADRAEHVAPPDPPALARGAIVHRRPLLGLDHRLPELRSRPPARDACAASTPSRAAASRRT